MSEPKARADEKAALVEQGKDAPIDRADEPPVVTRLIIEIRSDGTRTIARGAAEHVDTGEKVAIEVEGKTPLQLAFSLAKAIGDVTTIARSGLGALVARALPPKRK